MARHKVNRYLNRTDVPRSGWDEAFAQMHRDGADKLIIPEFENDFDLETW
jgi:hypothetical protein